MSHSSQQTPFLPSTMADVTITKGSKVEVSSDEPGFYGAWYEATIIDIVPLSTKKRQKKKVGYLVKYDTLYDGHNLEERLSEAVDPAFVRPLPPKNDDVEFEVMDVVDCYHRDGWWIGFVENVIVVVESGEDVKKKYVVRFEDPVEAFEFEKTQMRPHFDWVDSCWKLAPKKVVSFLKSFFWFLMKKLKWGFDLCVYGIIYCFVYFFMQVWRDMVLYFLFDFDRGFG